MPTQPVNSTLASARWYASKYGWHVIPLHTLQDGKCTCGKETCTSPGKHPRTANGLKDATTDIRQINAWWEKWPEANLGVTTGKESGLTILDIDPKHGGDDELIRLIQTYGTLGRTPEVITGSGGTHLYFQYVPGLHNSAGKIAPGIDVRGEGGYVVAPPSLHVSGKQYLWEYTSKPNIVAIAPMPDWLLKLAKPNDGMATVDTPRLEGDHPKGDSVVLSKSTLDFIVQGAPIGSQRFRALAAARNMLSVGLELADIQAKIWTGLSVSLQEPGREPWTREETDKLVSQLSQTPAPILPLRNDFSKQHLTKRREVEVLFCAAVMKAQELALRFAGWLSPKDLLTPELRQFWERTKAEETPMSVASDLGITAELLSWLPFVDEGEIGQYAQAILDAGYMRSIERAIPILSNAVSTLNSQTARETIDTLAKSVGEGSLAQVGDSPGQAFDKLSHLVLNPGTHLIGTAFPEFDEKLGGMERKTLTVLAARPGMGKTTFSFQLVREIVEIDSGVKVLFASIEMPTEMLWGKTVSASLGYKWIDVIKNRLSPEQKGQIALEIESWRERYRNNLYVYDHAITLQYLWRLAAHHQPDILVVDHLRLVGGYANVPYTERLGIVSSGLKNLAKEFNLSLLLLHQLSRANESRDVKIPMLSDLRQSGEIEEDADNVYFLHRDDYYETQDYTQSVSPVSETMLVTPKNRYGEPNQALYFAFDKRYQKFSEKKTYKLNEEPVQQHWTDRKE